MVANFLKNMEISCVLSCCEFVENSTVSFISRIDSKSLALIKYTSEALTPLPCDTGATGGNPMIHCLLEIALGRVRGGVITVILCSLGKKRKFAVSTEEYPSVLVSTNLGVSRGFTHLLV